VFPEDGTTYEQLLANADHLMYRDKAARRNRMPMPARAGNTDFIDTDIIDTSIPVTRIVPLPRFAS
jgi:hypothetical protein